MARKWLPWVMTFAMLHMLHTTAFSQKGKWGFGFGATGTSLTSTEAASTSMGYGGEGIFSLLFSENLSLNWIVGYNNAKLTPIAGASALTTNLLSSTLTMDYELSFAKKFKPFLAFGVGGHNFKVGEGDRFSDGEGAIGGGARIYMGNRTALYVSGLYKLSLGDALDGIDNGERDGYLNVSAGLQFFRGGKKMRTMEEPQITEHNAMDDLPPVDSLAVGPTEADSLEHADAELADFLKGKKDELENRLNSAANQIDQLKSEIAQKDSQITQLKTQQIAQSESVLFNPDNIKEMYAKALDLFYAKKYGAAYNNFQKLLENVPAHPLKANFIYWSGECLFAQGRFAQSIVEFEKVLAYPRSSKRDDALMMLGRANLETGKIEAARASLKRIVQEFPKSEYKAKAEQYLARPQLAE